VPSAVDVALPSSSTSTSDLAVALLMMYAMSCISTMKLLLLVSMLSEVPTCSTNTGGQQGHARHGDLKQWNGALYCKLLSR
jgi:hypothetical protein